MLGDKIVCSLSWGLNFQNSVANENKNAIYLRRAGYLFEVVFVKCVCIRRTSVFFQFYGVLSGVIYNYSPSIFFFFFFFFFCIQSHTFAAENCAIGNIVK